MDRELRELLDTMLRKQHGLITRQQALRSGVSISQIDRLLRTGRWIRLERGIFGTAAVPETDLQRIMRAVLSVGEEAFASHESAAHLLGLISFEPRRIHVTVRRPRWRSRAFSVHRSTDLGPDHQTRVQLIPVTTPARTIVDMGATAGRRLTERALDSALRSGAAELDDIQQVIDDVGRQGRRGVALARELVGERRAWVVATESELEEDFARLVRSAGLRLPESQVELREGEDGSIGRADFAYLDRRLVVELDGYGFHSDPAAFKRDRERQNRILIAGYRILRYTAADLRNRPSGVVAEIRAALSVPDNGRVENRRGD